MNKKTLTIVIIFVSIFLILGSVATYAYYTTIASGTSGINLITRVSSNESLTFSSVSDLSLSITQDSLVKGGNDLQTTAVSTVTLTPGNLATGTTKKYYAYLIIDNNTFEYGNTIEPELVLDVTETHGGVTTNVISDRDITTSTGLIELAGNYEITSPNSSAVTHTWNVKVTFVNLDTNQSYNTNKNFTATIYISPEIMKGVTSSADVMLKKLGIKSINTSTPDFTVNPTSQTSGVYRTIDDYGTSYIFRGILDNNWVYFADNYWRIIKVNGDGSLKLIYSGSTKPTNLTKNVMTGDETGILYSNRRTINYNSVASDNAYVGFKYGVANSLAYSLTHTNLNNSNIKIALDSWYQTNILNKYDLNSNSYDTYVKDTVYCYDRTILTGNGFGSSETSYRSSNLLNGTSPSLICSNANDMFTSSSKNIGGKITSASNSKVGLLSADEAIWAGLTLSNNNNSYLYTNKNYWLGTAYSFDSNTAKVTYVTSDGALSSSSVSSSNSIRPVISLDFNYYIEGNGTYDNPYKLVTYTDKVDNNPLPFGYQQVEYLQSGNGTYLDLNFVPDSATDYEYELVCKMNSFYKYAGIFGSYESESKNATRLIVANDAGTQFYTYIGNRANSSRLTVNVNSVTDKFKITLNYSKIKLYDYDTETEVEKNLNNPTSGDSSNVSFKVFRIYSTVMDSKFWSIKVKKNNVLIRDLVPCYRTTDNVAGMYDIVNDVFYTNQGTGSFVVGPDID